MIHNNTEQYTFTSQVICMIDSHMILSVRFGPMNLNYITIDSFCQKIDMSQPWPVIDMKTVTFITPYALIYLASFINHHNRFNVTFRAVYPDSVDVRGYLHAQRFWERLAFKGLQRSKGRGIAQWTSFRDMIQIANTDYIAEDVGKKLYDLLITNAVHVNARELEIVFVELVDNFSRHSDEEVAICAAQWYPRTNRLHLAIGDCGIGIRKSLSRNAKFSDLRSKSHGVAAAKAFEEKVGRTGEGGMGLTDARETIGRIGGQLFLSTGDAWILTRGEDELMVGRQEYDLPGVQIELSIPTEA